jgi:putative membrane protein
MHEIQEEIMNRFVSLFACGVLTVALGCSKERAQNNQQNQTQPSSNPSATDQAVTTNAQSAALNADDRAFLEKAAVGGKAEVELGQLAQEKAQSEQVKQFAQRMVTDHSQANSELVSMGDKMQLTLPTALDQETQDLKNKLSKLNGAKFDKEYMKAMVDDHQKDMQEFEKAAGNAVNSDVKSFASKTSAVIRQHLDLAKSINDGLK